MQSIPTNPTHPDRPGRSPLRRALAISSLGVSALLAGCAVGPDYVQPDANVPTQFARAAERPAVTERDTLATWWTTLNDPLLTELVRRAIADNLDLKLADARVRQSRAARGVIAADFGPNIDMRGSYARQRQSANQFVFGGNGGGARGLLSRLPGISIQPGQAGPDGVIGPPTITVNPSGAGGAGGGGGGFPFGQFEQDLYQLGFDATWEIDVWGGIRRAVEAAQADIAAADESRRDVLVTLISEVGRNYVELRGFQKRLEIARRNIAAQRDTRDLARSRFAAGLVGELDVAQADSQLASSESVLPLLEAGEAQAAHRLGVLLGQAPGALLAELQPAAPIPLGPPGVPAGLPSDLLRRRPDIRRTERELAAATARIGEATADLFPRFSLTGSFGTVSADIANILDWRSRAFNIGPSVRWPIFDTWRIRSNIEVRNAQQEQALQAYYSAILIALEDVENALTLYAAEQRRFRSLQEAVTANRRALALSSELYSKGLTSFLNLLDAERSLFASEDALVQSERAVTTNLIALYKALGGGWSDAAPTTNSDASVPMAESMP